MTELSRATSIILVIVYFLYLWTQIRSEKYAYKPLIQLDDPDMPEMVGSVEMGRASIHSRTLSYPRAPLASPPLLSMSDSKSYDSFDTSAADASYCTPAMSLMSRFSAAINAMLACTWVQRALPVVLLVVSTGLISVCSENLVSRVDHFVAHSPVSKTMVGLIILPIVGNAAELVSGVLFASRKQMDLAFAVSIGSAIQIALFVTPLIVLIGWGIDRDMSLHFTAFESVALTASSVLFLMLVFDSQCSVLKGVCLCAAYAIIA
jgi:Ca2+:H+ antiporter